MNEPLISVIIPVYNCEKTIDIAIDSIRNQTYKNLEILVVDDASTDNTKERVKKITEEEPRLRLIDGEDDLYRFDKKLNRNINAGYSARNMGFKYARGELITFQDADDASFLNRIETQYALLSTYNAIHVTIDWIRFNNDYVGKLLRTSAFVGDMKIMKPKDLYKMSQRSKGLVAKISLAVNRLIPFYVKRKRVLNKLFFGSLEDYPGAGNSPLFRREVVDAVRFRRLPERVWPSFMGRGADKDFNFHVAETFKNSYMFPIPLYLWRVDGENAQYTLRNIKEDIFDKGSGQKS
jgi:glycosyltransferase involved in cell wall biosynthesis